MYGSVSLAYQARGTDSYPRLEVRIRIPRHCLYINKEQQGSQDCALRDFGRNWNLSRCLTLNHNLLVSVGEKTFDPLQEVSLNPIMMQFDCESLMTDLFERLLKSRRKASICSFPPWLKLGFVQLRSADSRTNASS